MHRYAVRGCCGWPGAWLGPGARFRAGLSRAGSVWAFGECDAGPAVSGKCCLSECLAGSAASGGGATTIYALSTGRDPAALAVLRTSGPIAGPVLCQLLRTPCGGLAKGGRCSGAGLVARRASLCALFHPWTAELLDRGVVTWFPGPRTYTGEDMAEFSVHGSPAVVEGVLDAFRALGHVAHAPGSTREALATTAISPGAAAVQRPLPFAHPLPGLALAHPGEFTQRALAHGRISLDQVEALSDLLRAETRLQRRQALGGLSGRLSVEAARWAATLTTALARVEAGLELGDDDPAEAELCAQAVAGARAALTGLITTLEDRLARDLSCAERVRSGVRIVLVGAANAGKSSLYNRLVDRDAAIVSASPGTTRDALQLPISLDGAAATLVDTAGLRPGPDPVGPGMSGPRLGSGVIADPVEAAGIARSLREAGRADVLAAVADVSAVRPLLSALLATAKCHSAPSPKRSLDSVRIRPALMVVLNKIDLLPEPLQLELGSAGLLGPAGIRVPDPAGSGRPEPLASARWALRQQVSTAMGSHARDSAPLAALWLACPPDQSEPSASHRAADQVLADAVWIATDSRDERASGPSIGPTLSHLVHTTLLRPTASASASSARPIDLSAAVPAASSPVLLRERHHHHASACLVHLHHALTQLDRAPELAAEDLRLARDQLDALVGRADGEVCLDTLFAEFCIGK